MLTRTRACHPAAGNRCLRHYLTANCSCRDLEGILILSELLAVIESSSLVRPAFPFHSSKVHMSQTPKSTLSFVQRALSSKWMDRLLLMMFLIALSLLCFIGGAYVAETKAPLYRKTLKPAFDGIQAIHTRRDNEFKLQGWYRVLDDKIGTTTYDPSRAYDGLTLYTSIGDCSNAKLISMNGSLVHEWKLPFREVWPKAPHVAHPISESNIHWRRVLLFANGDLLANYTGISDTPDGYGLAKVDKNSRLIWRYSDNAHHDFDVDKEGQIYLLTHSIRHKGVKSAPQLRSPMVEDFLVVLSPEGHEIQRLSIYDAFANSKFNRYLKSMTSNDKGDHTHANTVNLVPAEFANHYKFCSAGDVMISVRTPSLIAIVNLERGKVVWASHGPWSMQHDPDPLPNGNILLFDNRGNRAGGGRSRILEWNPASGAIEWYFNGNSKDVFESFSRGSQQLLPNGNVLVTESNSGRLREITRDREIVWEYYNPWRRSDNGEWIGVVCSAVRYQAEELDFLRSKRVAHLSQQAKGPTKSNERPMMTKQNRG